MDLENRIIEKVSQYHDLTGGKCGITPIQLADSIDLQYKEIKNSLNKLHTEQKIKVRKGANHYLLFKA